MRTSASGPVPSRAGALDPGALLRGAGVALAVGAAAAVVAALSDAADDPGSDAALPLVLVALAGLAAGGWVAARTCPRAPLAHGAVAALAAVAVLVAVAVVRSLVGDDDVRWAYVPVWVLLAVACGLAGALAALRPRRRRPAPGGD